MTQPTIREHNLETGEIIDREMNTAELAQWKTDRLATETKLAAETAKAAEKQAILDKLGITAEQAKLLLS